MTNEPIERLRQLVEVADPDGTVTVRWLAGLIGESVDDGGVDEDAPQLPRDLTVEEVAEHFKRAPSTVRHWLGRGEIRGYKLNGRDWRIPRPALAEYEQAQREGLEPDTEEVDIREWRRAS